MSMSSRTVVAALALGLSWACMRGHRAEDQIVAGDSSESIELAVENHNWADVVVSIEHDGSRQRLGTVKAASRQSLLIPFRLIGPSHVLRLVARRIGALGEFRSEGFTVQHDQSIDWTLESDLARSSLGIR